MVAAVEDQIINILVVVGIFSSDHGENIITKPPEGCFGALTFYESIIFGQINLNSVIR